ncbi:MAG: PQQ-binding-like beta-propeller repeat protein [Pirellula sp.]
MPNQGIGGIAVMEDFVVVSSRDREDRQDVFSCLDAQTGVAFWQHAYAAPGNLDYGNSPRATPVIFDPYVIVLGAFGDLYALDLESGDVVWKKNLIRDLDGTLPQWGYAASPIVVEEKIIVQPGGANSSIVALDLKSGEIVWRTPGRRAAYASPVVYQTAGTNQIIGFDAMAVVAWDASNGNKLWEVKPSVKNDFNVPSPVLVPGGMMLTSENNATRFHRFDTKGGLSEAPTAEFLELAGDSHTPIQLGNRLIGVDRDLMVLDLDRSLELVAKHSDPSLLGYCSLIGCGDRVLVTCEDGNVLLLQLESAKIHELGRLRVGGSKSQILSHPAVAGTRFFVRTAEGIEAWQLVRN